MKRIIRLCYGSVLNVLAGPLFRKYKNIILIVEEKDARVIRDNGYWFVRYLSDNNLMRNQAFLVVNELVQGIPEEYQVKQGTLKHFGLIRRLSFILFTHGVEYVFPINMRDKLRLKYLVDSWHLGHGIYFFKKWDDIFKFFPANISVRYESGYTDYDEQKAQENGFDYFRTGLCRWDYLEDKSKKNTVLYCPTWRRTNIENQSEIIDRMREKIDFVYNAFQNSPYELTIILHRYLCELLKDKRVTATDNLTEYIQSSEILITDYSSIFADFQVQGKSVYLYAPDEDLFFEQDVGLLNRPSEVTLEDYLLCEDFKLMRNVVSPSVKGLCCEKTYLELNRILTRI